MFGRPLHWLRAGGLRRFRAAGQSYTYVVVGASLDGLGRDTQAGRVVGDRRGLMAEGVGHVRREVAIPGVLIVVAGRAVSCGPGRWQIGRDVAGTAGPRRDVAKRVVSEGRLCLHDPG